MDDATVEAIAAKVPYLTDADIRAVVAVLPDPRPTERQVREAWDGFAYSESSLAALRDLGCFRPEEDTRG